MSTATRKPVWGQPTPRMQVVAILSAVEGHVSNAEIGLKRAESLSKAQGFLRDAQQCLTLIPETPWPDTVGAPPAFDPHLVPDLENAIYVLTKLGAPKHLPDCNPDTARPEGEPCGWCQAQNTLQRILRTLRSK